MARQNFLGLVVSQGKMEKTVKVRVLKKAFDRRINKEILKRKDFLVHDEAEVSREGDLVRIEQCVPMSKRKSFSIAEIRKNQGQQFAKYDEIARAQVSREENQKTREFLQRRTKTSEALSSNTSLISDLTLVEKYSNKPAESLDPEIRKEVLRVQTKYGIKSWPPQKDVLKLQIQTLREEIDQLKGSIDSFDNQLQALVADKEQCDKILIKMGHEIPDNLKKNVRKNILRKYLLKNGYKGIDEQVKELSI